MRIDKYLWCVRLFKTRSIASEICRKNKVGVNGQESKPSREVKPGDKIRLRRDQISFEFEVLDLPKSRVGAKLVELYLRDITPQSELDRWESMKLARVQYQNVYREGRPTKKDRRSIEDFLEEWNDGDVND